LTDYFMKLLRWGHVIEKYLLAHKSLEQFIHMSYSEVTFIFNTHLQKRISGNVVSPD
jgi:hypothetical protein